MIRNRNCVLFTKNFPFGILENYILSELPFLQQVFERIYIVPVSEFEFDEKENRLKGNIHVEVVRLNQRRTRPTVPRLIRREWIVWKMMACEWLLSRERGQCFKFRHVLLSTLRQSYQCAGGLHEFMLGKGLDSKSTVFYHYWFHNGLIITNLYHRLYAHGKIANVARAHSGDLYHRDWRDMQPVKEIIVPFEQLKWKEVDRIFAISSHGLNFMERHFPQWKKKTGIARLGVADHGLNPHAHGTEEKVVLTCSLLSENKRLFLLPDLLGRLNFSVRWVHFGNGSEDQVHEVEEALRRFPNVRWDYLGFRQNSEIIQFYKDNHVDLVCNISKAEGIPVALMEAASFGVPMLATETVGNPEIVNDDNGILVPIDFDPDLVADRINELFASKEIWDKKSAAARKTFEENYDADKNYKNFCQILTQA